MITENENMDKTNSIYNYNYKNETSGEIKYDDFGSNQLTPYRKQGLGRTIVFSLWFIIALSIILCVTSIIMFSKVIKSNKEILSDYNAHVTGLSAYNEQDNTIRADLPVQEADKDTSHSTPMPSEDGKINLYTLKIVASEGAFVSNGCENTVGDKYVRAIVCQNYSDAHVTYYLNRQYSQLSTDISVLEHSWVSEVPYTFEIFADNDENKMLYSTTLSRTSAVQHVEIDVTGVEFITFRATHPNYSQYPTFILSDAVISE